MSMIVGHQFPTSGFDEHADQAYSFECRGVCDVCGALLGRHCAVDGPWDFCSRCYRGPREVDTEARCLDIVTQQVRTVELEILT